MPYYREMSRIPMVFRQVDRHCRDDEAVAPANARKVLNKSEFVIPAKAGIQKVNALALHFRWSDPGLRRDDD